MGSFGPAGITFVLTGCDTEEHLQQTQTVGHCDDCVLSALSCDCQLQITVREFTAQTIKKQ